jgi:hypothetical protein
MGELIPVIGGVLVGMAVAWTASARRIVFGAGVLAVALLAAGLNGELAESPGYLIVDTLIAATAAAVVFTLLRVTGRAGRRAEEG